MHRSLVIGLLASVFALTANADAASPAEEPAAEGRAPLSYPRTRTAEVAEQQFGVAVADPYRWLENDVRSDAEVKGWVEAQNAVTDRFLATLPGRAALERRITEFYDYERFGAPVKKGGRYFYAHNSGLQNQSVLFVRESLGGEGRVLIDANTWSADGATALADWTPSEDGRYLVYSIQDGGSDWRTVKVLDVATGEDTGDEVKWVKFSGMEWAKDGSGFFYTRFPEPQAGQEFQSTNLNARIYFHKLGTPQTADRLVYATPDKPSYGHYASVSDDGRWLVVTTAEGTDDRYEVHAIDLRDPGAEPKALVTGLENNWSFIGNEGARFFFITNKDAPKLKIVAMDVGRPGNPVTPVVAESEATLDGASIVGRRLIASYLADAKSQVSVHDLQGRKLSSVDLPGIGTAGGFRGDMGDAETFFSFSSFNRPTTIYRYDVRSGEVSEWAVPKVAFNPDDYAVEQVFYASKDGTRVPMFIVRKKGTSGPAPTLLYAYGGFNVSLTPSFSPTRLAWLEQGGVFALANLRGGGEYGKAWHDAGRLAQKQNVFDDFIAAGEYLKANGIASPKGLAIQGGSNGGLLVGAVVNQRPDLFDAANAAVGVMDMLRFDRFTAGRYWVDDYGYPDREADFRTLLAYSPYHNIKPGVAYPPMLVTTADTDDRVVPGHSFKYIAALQAADPNGQPHLIRIETRAGHGSGKPTDKIIEEASDVLAFFARFTGLQLP
ncbi:prolyl oligopeptidase family serine peptidase [Altererythrobacter soli]|uniref:prolyl oligopeptidase n=2 Tax=Croceibacterium soli TaxID=1739690 RepID=A0A6I4UTY4_9SPHN|nr:prolyl oligopeptidase family serine peptidase [Croceibacterium soli]